jgi:hypothetical protein
MFVCMKGRLTLLALGALVAASVSHTSPAAADTAAPTITFAGEPVAPTQIAFNPEAVPAVTVTTSAGAKLACMVTAPDGQYTFGSSNPASVVEKLTDGPGSYSISCTATLQVDPSEPSTTETQTYDVIPAYTLISQTPGPEPLPVAAIPAADTAQTTTVSPSENWSGYVERASGLFTGATGTFTIPTANPAAVSGSDTSIWVGLDGWGGHPADSGWCQH